MGDLNALNGKFRLKIQVMYEGLKDIYSEQDFNFGEILKFISFTFPLFILGTRPGHLKFF